MDHLSSITLYLVLLSAFFVVSISVESDTVVKNINVGNKKKDDFDLVLEVSSSMEVIEKTSKSSRRLLKDNLELGSVILSGNSTILSLNRTFELGFFTSDGGSNWYLGMWYASIPIHKYVWVANRKNPIKTLRSGSFMLTKWGQLAIRDSSGSTFWQSENSKIGSSLKFLDNGNLILFDRNGEMIWQSFDHPTDTILLGMNFSSNSRIIPWKNPSDPSPGHYTMRMRKSDNASFELVVNDSIPYWYSGIWTGKAFTGVPEMSAPYFYNFTFYNVATPNAYLTITLIPKWIPPDLHFVDHHGRFKQQIYSRQTGNWDTFYTQPVNLCDVYGLCGNLGFCRRDAETDAEACTYLDEFAPVNPSEWTLGEFSGGCRKINNVVCQQNDEFIKITEVDYDASASVSIDGDEKLCKESCLSNCSCIGVSVNSQNGNCQTISGNLFNLQNVSETSRRGFILYLRIDGTPVIEREKKTKTNLVVFIFSGIGVLGIVLLVFLVLKTSKKRGEIFLASQFRVFTYKELYKVTRGFSEKIGQGGFGAVYRGELLNSSPVAVKRLERGSGGDREFRAEVFTIGNIQHVNLVRLRGFCCENPHRILVLDYLPNGSLNLFLGKEPRMNLTWNLRFQIALGTARGIAYLHEECIDCIIHCDIKPENILLDNDFIPKISDFGLAKLVGRDLSRILTTVRGTWGYVAPEWITGVAITAKADVYSYGITLFEILSGQRNYNPEEEEENEEFFPVWASKKIIEGNTDEIADKKFAGNYDQLEFERLAKIAVWCIQYEEAKRPPMKEVIQMLEGVIEVKNPPVPKLVQSIFGNGSQFPVSHPDFSDQNSSTIGVVASKLAK